MIARCSLLFILLLWCHASGAHEFIELNSSGAVVYPTREILLIEDPSGVLTFDEARRLIAQEGEYWNGIRHPIFGFSKSVFWARLDLHNDFINDETWVIHLNRPGQTTLEVYYPTDSDNWYHSSQGTLQPFSNRDIQVPVQNVRIPVFAGQPQSIYIRFADEGFTELPIQVSSLNTFKSVIADNIFFKGLQFGAIGVATFITLLIWLVTGRLTLLWLGLLFLSSGVFAMFLSGYTFQYIFPNNPRLNQQIGIVSDILSNGFLLMFIGGLLSFPGRLAILRWVLISSAITVLGFCVMAVYQPSSVMTAYVSIFLTIFSVSLCMIISTVAFAAQNRTTRLFIIGSFFFGAGILLTTINIIFNNIPDLFLFHSTNTMLLMAAVVLVLLCIEIVWKPKNVLRLEHIQLLRIRNHSTIARGVSRWVRNDFRDMLIRFFLTPLSDISHSAVSLGASQASKDSTLAHMIQERSTQLATTVNQLLGQLQPDDPGQQPHEIVDLQVLIDDVMSRCQPHSEARSIPIRVDRPKGPIYVTADADGLEMVLLNLLVNAIEFCTDGTVGLRITRNAHNVNISISDTGPGFPEHILRGLTDPPESVFHLFELKDGVANAGLGLQATRLILADHHSRLEVAKRTDGAGTIVSFSLLHMSDLSDLT